MKIKRYEVPLGEPYINHRASYCLVPETKEEVEILNIMAQDCSGTLRLGYNGNRKQEDGAVGIELKVYTARDDEDHRVSSRGRRHRNHDFIR